MYVINLNWTHRPLKPPANSYAPRDFSFQHERLHLLEGARLGPQIEVVDDSTTIDALS